MDRLRRLPIKLFFRMVKNHSGAGRFLKPTLLGPLHFDCQCICSGTWIVSQALLLRTQHGVVEGT